MSGIAPGTLAEVETIYSAPGTTPSLVSYLVSYPVHGSGLTCPTGVQDLQQDAQQLCMQVPIQ